MANMKEIYGQFLDPFTVPKEEEICYYIYKQLSLPSLNEAIDHYYAGVSAIADYLSEKKNPLMDYAEIEYMCEDWFHLPVHVLLPILIRIIL